uniref:LysR family transcriptional regulator TtgS n=1 Tax=Pseudomonas fluorescens TaxID=294 RepID=A0A220ITC1_PSEFL|nr:LysR substrate-binding domain-containing protein [Pseudomonas fluorescens]ASI38107.1 Putative LysR family transcriptional regulator TtgS [Pseudomonas fluorescens]AWH58704.1 Putative LysR family transcriptional regulator TtgS [Pseudomonas fluorescens]
MNRSELRKADINLMVTFETLMQERNVTRAASKLFVSQPAVSAQLNRLRDLFNDPLFIRVGNRMEPTARANEIIQHLSQALDAMSAALSLTHGFDPTSSDMTLCIGLSDDVEYGLLPPLLRAIREEAPGIVIVIRRVNFWDVAEQLISGAITVAVCLTRELPANAKRKALRKVQPMVLRADKSAKPLTLDDYCTRPHVVVSHVGSISSFADEWLRLIGRERRAVLSVAQFSTLPALMAGTDLLCDLPDHLIMAVSRSGLVYAEPHPFVSPELELSMVWLSMMDTDPAERWLRMKLEQFMGQQ